MKLAKTENSGAPQHQITIFTYRIRHLTEHLKKNKKDHSAKRGLIGLVGKRKKMLKYLQRKDTNLYKATCKKLTL